MESFLIDSWDEIRKKEQIDFLKQQSLCQANLFHLSKFSRQPVTLSGEFILLDWFSQTRCLRILILLINFLR